MACEDSTTRRTFLKNSAAATIGAGLLMHGTAYSNKVEAEGSKPAQKADLAKRTLGRTDLKVADISFGGIQIQQERLLDVAIDRGINLIHTSPGYGKGRSIELFGKVMKRRRNEVFLALKQNPIGGIDEQLRILNTDHVDILMPPLHTVDAMNNPNLPGAYEKLKKEGKIRYSGFACHKNIADVMNRAIDLGFFDVMLIAYHLGNREEIDPILARAKKEQNMGFMVMKSTREVDRKAPEALSTAFKTLLQNKNVDTLLIGMSSFAEVEQNVGVSGKSMGVMDRVRMRDYAALGASACAMCGACDGCPRGVAVCDILRYKSYYDRGEQDLARSSYRDLPAARTLANCDGCGACERACPRSRRVLSELRSAHRALA